MLKRLIRDERGNILVLTCAVIMFLLLLTGLATDIARAWVAREELLTTVQAASLAGARNAEKYVEVNVLRGHREYEVDDKGRVSSYCATDGLASPPGKEDYIIGKGGWRRNSCDSFLGIEERWLEYPANTESIANSILDLNWPSLLDRKDSSKITVYSSSSPYGPSVKAEAEGGVETTFLKLIGINDIPISRAWQSASFYDVIKNGWSYGRNDSPADATGGN